MCQFQYGLLRTGALGCSRSHHQGVSLTRAGGSRAAVGALTIIVLAALALPRCSTDGSREAMREEVEGVRSDPDHRGLVVSYIGGACDGPARLDVTETATRVETEVRIGLLGTGACPSIGILRSVSARLAGPLGARSVWIAGEQIVPFDGARVLKPSLLPAGFSGVRETGDTAEAAASPDGLRVTTTWITTHFKPLPAQEACGLGGLEVRLGARAAAQLGGLTKVGQARIGPATAQLYQSGTERKPDLLAYAWNVSRQPVVTSSSVICPSDTVLSATELLSVAESLKPA